MRLKTHKRMTRKAAVAAALLGATLVLPGSAVADHNPNNNRDPFTCDPAIPDDCPHFEANAKFRVQNPVKNQSSAVNFEFSQPDRRMPVMFANYYLPTGWRFGGLSTIDAAIQGPDDPTPGAPATNCGQIFNPNGSLQNAELLSAGTGMTIHKDNRRGDNPDNLEEAGTATEEPVFGPGGVLLAEFDAGPIDYGYRPTDPITGNPPRFPSVSLLNWDGTTANLCYMHRTNDNTSGRRDPLPVDFRNSATLTRLAGDPNFDWRVSYSLANVYDDPGVIAQRSNILRHNIELGSLTAGNWNRHPETGQLNKVHFSRTPLTPGDYTFRAELFTCAQGMSSSHPSGCVNGTFSPPIVVDQVIPITPAPDTIKYEFGRLTGPATAGLCSSALCAAGLVRGTNQFGVSWSQPPLVDGQAIRGYVLTLALPGNQQSRKFYRFVTDPDTPGFNASVCGPAGGDPSCTFNISLPVQSSDGSTTLTPDKKYHLALVTIYSDGRRTDLLCDDATGAGVACPASLPRLNRQEPGISEWQVLHRSDAWPLVYVETWGDTAALTGNPHDPFINRTLLVDFSLKEAEFITWNNSDAVTSYRAVSNGIIGDNSIPLGVVEMNNGTSAGSTQNWAVAIAVTPLPDIPGLVPGNQAVGVWARYDVKNVDLDPINVSGWPELGQKGCEIVLDCFSFLGGRLS